MAKEDTTGLLETDQKLQDTEDKLELEEEVEYEDETQTVSFKLMHRFLSTIIAILSGVCFGYDVGIMSNWLIPTNETMNLVCKYTDNINCTEDIYVTTPWLLGAIFSAIFGGIIIDFYGTKLSIFISCLLMVISSSFFLYLDLQFIILSKLIAGFSGPLLTIGVSIFMAEGSEANIRGARVMLHQVGISFGVLIIWLLCYIEQNGNMWEVVIATKIIFSIIIIIILSILSSPHFFELKYYKKAVIEEPETSILQPNILLLLLLITSAERFCGHFLVPFHTIHLVSLLGFCVPQALFVTVFSITIIKFISVIVCVYIVNREGRRFMLIVSSLIMILCMIVLAIIAKMDNIERSVTIPPKNVPLSSPPYPMLPTPLSLLSQQSEDCSENAELISTLRPIVRCIAVAIALLYQVAESFGIGTLIWIILIEILPAAIRGRTICCISIFFWVDFVTPIALIEIGFSISTCLFIFAATYFTATILIFLVLPETRGKTFEHIFQEMQQTSLKSNTYKNLLNLPYIKNNQKLKLNYELELSRLGIKSETEGADI